MVLERGWYQVENIAGGVVKKSDIFKLLLEIIESCIAKSGTLFRKITQKNLHACILACVFAKENIREG